MKANNEIYKIAIVDDNNFFNRIISKKVRHFTERIDLEKNYSFEVHSYLHLDDFERNLALNFDIVFLDYFLDNRKTDLSVIQITKDQSNNTKVAVISQVNNMQTSCISLQKGADAFIEKDNEVLNKVCFFIQDNLNNRLLC